MMPSYILLEACVEREVYELHARHLTFGVFDGRDAFIGIREKFGYRFLDSEYHAELNAPHGTAWPTRSVGTIPEYISLKVWTTTIDSVTGRPVAFESDLGWYFSMSGESSKEIRPQAVMNDLLFKALEKLAIENIKKEVE